METSFIDQSAKCASCGRSNQGNYCNNCGQSLHLKKITMGSLLHEVFHFFTHVEHGLLFTLKKLILAPGTMQREYLGGIRSRHQKPFSMYAISASVMALVLYWIEYALMEYYHVGEKGELIFFNKYAVLLLIITIPLSTLIVFLFFPRSGYGFAEVGVMQLYTLSLTFIIVAVVHFLKFIWPEMETRFVEVPLFLFYNAITFANFFNKSNKRVTIVKSIIAAGTVFLIVAFLQDKIIERYLM